MDWPAVPIRVDDTKTTSSEDSYYSVPEPFDNIQVLGIPWDRIESTLVSTLMDSTQPQSLSTFTPLSIPSTSLHHNQQDFILKCDYQSQANGTANKRKICESENEAYDNDDDYDGVLVIDEDLEDEDSRSPEMRFVSPNHPQQVIITQDQANGSSQLSLTRIVPTHPQSSSVTSLSMPSTSTRSNQQDVISNYESQPAANCPISKRKICESENEVGDDDSVQWIDYDGHENEKSSPFVKKLKLDSTRADDAQPKVDGQSKRQSAKESQEKEVNKQNRQVITLALQCPKWNCSQMFTTNQHTTAVNQLNHHLKVVHSIGLYRCMVLYCAESFPNNRALGQHLNHFHSGIKEWHCSKCPKHFTSYNILSHHKMLQHQLGQFECSFSACTFTAECKAKVASHYGNHHRVKPELVCQAKSDCVYRTTNSSLLKEHELAHLGIKPFRCTWPNCGHSSTRRPDTIRHIEKIHLSTKTSSSNEVVLAGQPVDYLSVDQSLL